VFTGRVLLAALDHNFHVFRKTLEGQFKKIYSKRSGNWRAEPVKEPKQYEYFALLQADILRRRAEDTEPVTRHIEVSPTNPINLAPTIAMKRPPPTEELVKAKLSRFQSKKNLCKLETQGNNLDPNTNVPSTFRPVKVWQSFWGTNHVV